MGNDSITNSGDYVSIDGGVGKDSITNSGDNASISLYDTTATASLDVVNNYGHNVTIFGVKEGDTINDFSRGIVAVLDNDNNTLPVEDWVIYPDETIPPANDDNT